MSCPICFDTLHSNEFTIPFDPKQKRKHVTIKFPCHHKFCRECATNYCKSIINETGKDFKCPIVECKTLFDPYGLITKIEINKYIKMNSKKTLMSCQRRNCEGNIISIGGEYRCNECYLKLCMGCLEISHTNACKKELMENVQSILKDCKPCPKCHVLIFKDGGCNHMHCLACQCDFDWTTGVIGPHFPPNELIAINAAIAAINGVDAMNEFQGLDMLRQIHQPDSIQNVPNQQEVFYRVFNKEEDCLMCKSEQCIINKNSCCWCSPKIVEKLKIGQLEIMSNDNRLTQIEFPMDFTYCNNCRITPNTNKIITILENKLISLH